MPEFKTLITLTGHEIKELAEMAAISDGDPDILDMEYSIVTGKTEGLIKVRSDDESTQIYRCGVIHDGLEGNEIEPLGEAIEDDN